MTSVATSGSPFLVESLRPLRTTGMSVSPCWVPMLLVN
jgi:hypothetical protein